jgi:hypothetical protein
VNLSEVLKDCCCRCAQSRRNSTLRSVRGLPQGVRARVFVETQNCVKLRKDKASKFVEEKHRESVSWSVRTYATRLCAGGPVFTEEYWVHP